MLQRAAPSGTDPEATGDSIIKAELEKLQDYRNKINEENQRYVDGHPELRTLIDEFVAATILHKPNDIVKFGQFFFNNWRKNAGQGPCPVIIAGPSGVGKGTIINKLLEKFPSIFGFSVSHTTRDPRPGEENGVHYNFVSKSDFEETIEKREFVEYAKVHTNYYGTSFKAVEKVRNQGKVCILDIDVQGVQNVKKSALDCKYIFISPPNMEELEKRLRGRGTETADKIKTRLTNAVKELEYSQLEGNFDKIIVNVELDKAVDEVIHVLQGWYPELDLYL